MKHFKLLLSIFTDRVSAVLTNVKICTIELPALGTNLRDPVAYILF